MGHGCGMSQNGAEYLASQGKTFEEILKTYYKNTENTIKVINLYKTNLYKCDIIHENIFYFCFLRRQYNYVYNLFRP